MLPKEIRTGGQLLKKTDGVRNNSIQGQKLPFNPRQTKTLDILKAVWASRRARPAALPSQYHQRRPAKRRSKIFDLRLRRNKSLYWHPTIYKVGKDPDTNEKTYEIAEVSFSGPYYRWDPEAIPKPVAFPPGFQMIAGMDPTVEGLELLSECLCEKPCTRSDGLCDSESDFFPKTAYGKMGIAMNFPTCWNEIAGIGDEGNHMDHMAYTVDGTVAGACPPGFDIRLPQIQLFVRLQNYEGGQYTFSDNTTPEDEEVFHADFMNGWDEGVLEQIVDECEAFPGWGDDFNPPCNCDQFLTKKSTLLVDDTDAEAANICLIDVTKHIVDEVITFGQGGLPRGSCSTPIITGVEPDFVENCGLEYTPNTFDEGNCEGDDSDDSDDEKCKDNKKFK